MLRIYINCLICFFEGINILVCCVESFAASRKRLRYTGLNYSCKTPCEAVGPFHCTYTYGSPSARQSLLSNILHNKARSRFMRGSFPEGLSRFKTHVIQDKFSCRNNIYVNLVDFLGGLALLQFFCKEWDFINIFYMALFQIRILWDLTVSVSKILTLPWLLMWFYNSFAAT
jgi:hypothetical protein